MRASWFRGRAPAATEVPVEPASHPAPGAGTPALESDVDPVAPTAGPLTPPIRPAFGHPTF